MEQEKLNTHVFQQHKSLFKQNDTKQRQTNVMIPRRDDHNIDTQLWCDRKIKGQKRGKGRKWWGLLLYQPIWPLRVGIPRKASRNCSWQWQQIKRGFSIVLSPSFFMLSANRHYARPHAHTGCVGVYLVKSKDYTLSKVVFTLCPNIYEAVKNQLRNVNNLQLSV